MDLNSPEFAKLCVKLSQLSPKQAQQMSDEIEAEYPDLSKQQQIVKRYTK